MADDLMKAGARGGKYTRREEVSPGKFRYFYDEPRTGTSPIADSHSEWRPTKHGRSHPDPHGEGHYVLEGGSGEWRMTFNKKNPPMEGVPPYLQGSHPHMIEPGGKSEIINHHSQYRHQHGFKTRKQAIAAAQAHAASRITKKSEEPIMNVRVNPLDIAAGRQSGELLKAGEGSRGGSVIGHTSSGKPIYASHSGNFAEHTKGWTKQDHKDAGDHHYDIARTAKVGARNKPSWMSGDQKDHVRASGYHHAMASAHTSHVEGKGQEPKTSEPDAAHAHEHYHGHLKALMEKSTVDPLDLVKGAMPAAGASFRLGSVTYHNPGGYEARPERSAPGLQPLTPPPGINVTDDAVSGASRAGGHLIRPDSGLRRDNE